MKTMVLTGIRKIEIVEQPSPALHHPTDVLLRIVRAGICGSDLHYYTQGRIGDQVVRFPFCVGHECSAVVADVGKQVTRFKPGDLVVVDPSVSCGVCDQCRLGHYHTCRKVRFLGCPGQLEGCLCDFIVMPEDCCYSAKGLTADQAALVEPLTIGYYAVQLSGRTERQEDRHPGERPHRPERASCSPDSRRFSNLHDGPAGLSPGGGAAARRYLDGKS